MMNIFIGMDDTDNLESRGTGRLARQAAEELSRDFKLTGVTRHQLLVDPRVPYTSHNSSAAIGVEAPDGILMDEIFERMRALMLSDFQPGSDPGLCIAGEAAALQLSEFGRRAQRELVSQAEARSLAAAGGVRLEGLGGSQDGVIGALAAVGLAASGEDGRYLLIGNSRALSGLQPVEAVFEVGITDIRTLDGERISSGLVAADKLRPARKAAKPVLFVEWNEDHWLPMKLD